MRNRENKILPYDRLFQQFPVDQWIKIESQRLDFACFNQDLFMIDMLGGFLDMLRREKREASQISRNKILSPNFIRGLRDMCRQYMNAIALVQSFEKLNTFLTMTCNSA